jgi:hypothetical protein
LTHLRSRQSIQMLPADTTEGESTVPDSDFEQQQSM